MSDHALPERINPAGMARLLNMSRARLYQLMTEGIFPTVSRDAEGRPFFSQQQQAQILEIYRTNVGANGKSIFFRPKETRAAPPSRKKTSSQQPKQDHTALLKTIRAMGLAHVTKADLEKCLTALFPDGRIPEESTALVRQVFVYLHSQQSSDKQDR